MRANKIFIDLYSTSGGSMPYEEYRKWYDKNDLVVIALIDCQIYTEVHRNEMFNKNMHHGCFIEHLPQKTPNDVFATMVKLVNTYSLRYVRPDDFIKIEKEKETERVKKAFAFAEKLIAQG